MWELEPSPQCPGKPPSKASSGTLWSLSLASVLDTEGPPRARGCLRESLLN